MATDWRTRRRDFLIYVVGRPLMFLFWSLVMWGSFYGIVLLHAAVSMGPTAAWQQTLSGRDQLGGVLNLGLTVFAVLVWSLVSLVVWTARRERRRQLVEWNASESGGAA